MPLRIHFTAEDLARTRLAEGLRPMLELDIAVRLLQEGSHPTRFGPWRRESFRRLSPGARGLFDLIPPTGWTVGFLDHATADTMDATVLRTAGLVTTLRHHNTALHSLSPLGAGLLGTAS
ncbi:hypothetical protein ACWGRF_09545 [Streptomyces zhihengii]